MVKTEQNNQNRLLLVLKEIVQKLSKYLQLLW